ncbi:uncharacterized protein CLUP02_04844 [Colletotrichum lupini]|uniref:Uncharacterized protein n=1 Tax=Colletotrichum lupini TaxID=145971 RepID=A0A9Q8SLI2_9PEZI|nr:uncharacterized protein CLUP02_04844 [Colletotrichum lupini]UQC79365.1 hypothetical protein CLUP02_04844 [Colletotrichum lupini]
MLLFGNGLRIPYFHVAPYLATRITGTRPESYHHVSPATTHHRANTSKFEDALRAQMKQKKIGVEWFSSSGMRQAYSAQKCRALLTPCSTLPQTDQTLSFAPVTLHRLQTSRFQRRRPQQRKSGANTSKQASRSLSQGFLNPSNAFNTASAFQWSSLGRLPFAERVLMKEDQIYMRSHDSLCLSAIRLQRGAASYASVGARTSLFHFGWQGCVLGEQADGGYSVQLNDYVRRTHNKKTAKCRVRTQMTEVTKPRLYSSEIS